MYTKFININVKNSTVNAPRVSYVALLAGLTKGCTFMDCNAENCKIIGQSRVGLFFSAEDEASSSQAINCKAENYTMYSYRCVDDNMGFICASPAELSGAVSIKVTDDECIIRQFVVKVDSLKVNGNEIIPDGLEYHIDKSNGPALLDIEFSFYESYDFSAFHYVENQTVEITGYEGTDKDIVIPEEVYGFDVVGLRGRFETYGMNNADVNSVTLPGVVKSIPDECFSDFSGLTKITLESGVEKIGNSAFENCEQLSEINLADSIKTIGEKAFFNCGAKSVTLGKNIEAIGDYAFGYSATETGGAAIEGFTICGYSGTAAETYAKANGFNFVDLSL
ncbi:MAG: leucine-rich repeat domain-containing protein [Clostridia bacterium]|nr:leucine-rich repeat domain-containing protein [Clostridia bacterium]